jgi:orotidine-5'-phosphate decarboxylase
MNGRDRILIPLDVDSEAAALAAVRTLAGKVGGFKVGLELIHAAGFSIFGKIREAGGERIFYDAKLHDIPNTVAGAVRAAARYGVWMLNVHASGGRTMLEAARTANADAATPIPNLIGVTVLTSLDDATLASDLRVPGGAAKQALHLARLSQSAGLDGIVCSPLEVAAVKRACGAEFVTVVPGVRPAGVAAHDQKRVATPGAAIAAGAHYLVIGRAITGAADPVAAADAIAQEIEGVLP